MKLHAAILTAVLAGVAGTRPARAGTAELLTFHMKGGRGQINFSVEDRGTGTASVEVWYSKDGGKNWHHHDTDTADARGRLSGKFKFSAKEKGEGVYDFTTVAVDKVGNREKELGPDTPPEFRVVVDFQLPEVTVKGPPKDTLVTKEATYSWACTDPNLAEKPVKVDYRVKRADPKEEAWLLLAEGLAASGERTFTMPEISAGVIELRFSARDQARNVGSVIAESVKIDKLPPVGKIIGPEMATSLDIIVRYQLEDQGPAGLAAVSIYITTDRGRTWELLAKVDDPNKEAARVKLPGPGSFGLALAATDAAGNELAPPRQGARPRLVVLTDTAKPRLTMKSKIEGQAFSPRKPMLIEWEAQDDNFDKTPITIHFSPDGGDTWELVAEGLANNNRDGKSGSYEWHQLPKVDSTRCLLRITAADVLGNEAALTTRPFTVDNKPPVSRATFTPIEDDEEDDGESGDAGDNGSGDKTVRVHRPSQTELLAEAQKFLDEKLYDRAVAAADRVLAKDPESGHACLIRGRARRLSDPEQALADLKRAAELLPEAEGLDADLAFTYFKLGKARFNEGDYQAADKKLRPAARHYNTALSQGVETAQKHLNLGITLVHLGRLPGSSDDTRALAIAELKKALEMTRRDARIIRESYWWLAEVSEDVGAKEDAVIYWNKAARLYGEDDPLRKTALSRAEKAGRRR